MCLQYNQTKFLKLYHHFLDSQNLIIFYFETCDFAKKISKMLTNFSSCRAITMQYDNFLQ